MKKKKKIKAISWIPRRLDVLESYAWRCLSPTARLVLERIEIEYMRQQRRGNRNGRLICTYANFVDHGVRRASIPILLDQCCGFGFLEITQRGHLSPDGKVPSSYRLTYLPTASHDSTDE